MDSPSERVNDLVRYFARYFCIQFYKQRDYSCNKTIRYKWDLFLVLGNIVVDWISSLSFRKRSAKCKKNQIEEIANIQNKIFQILIVKQLRKNKLQNKILYFVIFKYSLTENQYRLYIIIQIRQRMNKTQGGDLCKVPNNVVFNFNEDQEMHSTIIIQNIVDRIVTYKIKTNKPGIYLVKPMEGHIFNKSSVTITMRRKELTLQNFDMIKHNPGQARQRFLLEFSYEVEDSVGILHKCQQLAYLGVTFTKAQRDAMSPNPEKYKWNDMSKVRKDKLIKQNDDMQQLIEQKNDQLRNMMVERQTLQARNEIPQQQKIFKRIDLLNVFVVSFLMGFVIF